MDVRYAQVGQAAICGFGSDIRAMNMLILEEFGKRHYFVGLLLWFASDFANGTSRFSQKRQPKISAFNLYDRHCRNRTFLRSGTFLGNEIASYGRRILALVGRASLG